MRMVVPAKPGTHTPSRKFWETLFDGFHSTTRACCYGSPAFAGTTDRALPFPERAHQLVAERLHQIGEHGAVAGLHEGFHRHAGDDLLFAAEAGDFSRRH